MDHISKQENADILRLQHAGQHEINDILADILERDSDLSRLVEIVEQKLDQGIYIIDAHMARLIASTKSTSLYSKIREGFFNNTWELITLYEGQYPDPEIEKTLCSQLYEFAKNDAEPRRKYIVEAIRDVGSRETLPTLEAILFENNAPDMKAKQILANALDDPDINDLKAMATIIETKSRKSFLQLTQEAIASVHKRDLNPEEATKGSTSTGSIPFASLATEDNVKEQINSCLTHNLITKGENKRVEFKSTLRVNRNTNKNDPKMHFAVLKTIAAFLNTGGGTLIVGVDDNGTPVGVEVDNFPKEDSMSLFLDNLVNQHIGSVNFPYINPRFEDYNNKRILIIECEKSKRPVYVTEGNTPKFYIRANASTRELNNKETQEFIDQNFK